jgi:hypothetical protein
MASREFILNDLGHQDPHIERMVDLSQPHNWLQKLLTDNRNKYDRLHRKKLGIFFNINQSSLEVMPDSKISDQIDMVHVGLIHYVYTAWAREQGIVLTPDILFYTIICEIKNYIKTNPNDFRDLFTNKSDKQQIVVGVLTLDKLMNILKDIIPSKELFDVLTKTTFTTEPTHFSTVLGITFADMGTPYFSYMSSLCGIPKVKILGTDEDWNVLLTTMKILKTIFQIYSEQMTKYLDNITNNINKLILAIANNNVEYFRQMFNYKSNMPCDSGHNAVDLSGWILEYYMERRPYIVNYPSHLNCLPYKNNDLTDIRYYFYACGLSSSKIVDGYMYSQYDIIHCEIKHPDKEAIFNTLAMI